MNDVKYYIKKIRLADGIARDILDDNAPRKDAAIVNTLQVNSMTDMSATSYNVVTIGSDGVTKKRSSDNVLEDLGGCSFSMNDTTGVLTLKLGK